MLHRLASHNDDIRRLVEKGYAVAFDSNYLVVRDIPYLDAMLQLRIGAIVTKLVFIDQNRVTQEDHQIFFAGEKPYNLDGTQIPNLAGGSVKLVLSEASRDVIVERSFSNKPRTGSYADFYEKISSYTAIIAGPAIDKYGSSPYTFRTVECAEEDSVFKFRDTLTSRAEISDLVSKFKDDIVAIIGLGGTGSYVMDFIAKTPVREIKLFDLDPYYVHNAFRSPGRLIEDDLGKLKSEVCHSRYENFRTGIAAYSKYIDESNSEEFDNVTFAFVCVDKGSSRKSIFEMLTSKHIPFIDAGMGLFRSGEMINGMLRTTYYSAEEARKTIGKGFAQMADNPDDIYKTNIQISELNALNACLAVIRYKQLRGFYKETNLGCHHLLEVADLKIVGTASDED